MAAVQPSAGAVWAEPAEPIAAQIENDITEVTDAVPDESTGIPWEGTGEEEDPYRIADAAQLLELQAQVAGGGGVSLAVAFSSLRISFCRIRSAESAV